MLHTWTIQRTVRQLEVDERAADESQRRGDGAAQRAPRRRAVHAVAVLVVARDVAPPVRAHVVRPDAPALDSHVL